MKTRMYFLVNQYMMGIQAGIQAGHAACRLMAEHWDDDRESPRVKLIQKWFREDETFIVLDGGYQKVMQGFIDKVLFPLRDTIPYTAFHEETDSLNGALTAVAFILPEKIYGSALEEDGEAPCCYIDGNFDAVFFTEKERVLIKELKKFHLKRG